MLLLNFLGFAPSFFLKYWFETRELALRTHVHGIIFTGWFLLLMTQASLIARSNIRRHRQVGSAAVVLAILMVISALFILYHRVLLYHTGDRQLEGTVFVVWGNLSLLLAFTIFVALGFSLRRQSSFHKRLMILASVAMMPQALGRIGYFPQVRILDGFANNMLYAYGGILLLLMALALHDRLTEGRIHSVTIWGAPALILLILTGSFLLPQTPLGPALIHAVGS